MTTQLTNCDREYKKIYHKQKNKNVELMTKFYANQINILRVHASILSNEILEIEGERCSISIYHERMRYATSISTCIWMRIVFGGRCQNRQVDVTNIYGEPCKAAVSQIRCLSSALVSFRTSNVISRTIYAVLRHWIEIHIGKELHWMRFADAISKFTVRQIP